MVDSSRVICGPPEPQALPGPGSPDFADRLLDRLEKHGDKIAQISQATGESITFKEIRQKAIRLAISLQRLGIKKGDVIAISSENRFEFSICSIAILATGAISAPLNILYTKSELIHAMNISKPKVIFVSPLTLNNVIDVFNDLPSLKTIITFGDKKPNSKVILYQKMLAGRISERVLKPAKVDVTKHPVVILCSSGTTGMPKGVVLTHKNLIVYTSHIEHRLKSVDYSKACLFTLTPWFHSYGFNWHLGCLFNSLKIVFMAKFEEEGFLGAIEKYKVTTAVLVPPLMVFLAKHPLVDKYDLSSLNEIWVGAAPLSKETQEAVSKRIRVKLIKQGYGMTETTLGVLNNPYGVKPESCGKLVPGTKAKVVDLSTGEALGPFEKGELCFKGALMMKGYLGDAAATNNVFDSDGWLHTGDVGYYDNEEFFYIVDRIKELIKYKGFQVPPAEIEGLLLEHPSVKDVAVVGLPDEAAGELPLAFVVKQPNTIISEKELIDFVAKRLSKPKQLHGGVRFVNEIPKNPSGKILRRKLKELLKQKSKL